MQASIKVKRRLLGRLSFLDVAKALQKLGSLVRSARGGEDRLAVALQDAQPVADIVGVVGAWFSRDSKIATQERSAKLGNHFFHRIGIIAKALAKGARHAMFGTGPMGQLVQQG